MRINLSDFNTKYDPNTPTEENKTSPMHSADQQAVTIDGKHFMADTKLIPLLKALNEAGLITRTHCAGHTEGDPSWVAIRLDNVEDVYIRKDEIYNEIHIKWNKGDK